MLEVPRFRLMVLRIVKGIRKLTNQMLLVMLRRNFRRL
jgi:hypothetical protein